MSDCYLTSELGLCKIGGSELWNPKQAIPVCTCLENEGDVCIRTGEQWLSSAWWRIYVCWPDVSFPTFNKNWEVFPNKEQKFLGLVSPAEELQ